ncbi:MAG TPA: hypothetical protein DCF33_02175 [Saprospirales bacterium]|nr:hypothetical protein [Saprospirales bacterium]
MNQFVINARWCVVLLSICLASTSSAQTFSNVSAPNEKGYTIRLQLNPDGTADFAYQKPDNVVFASYTGTWQKVQDTIRFELSMQLGQFYMKAWDEQEVYIKVDSLFAERFPVVRFRYANGDFRRLSCISRKQRCKPTGDLHFLADPRRFSNQKGKDYYVLELPVIDPFNNAPLIFTIPFGSNSTFVADRKMAFQAVLQQGSLQTVGTPVLQTGHFSLQLRD